MHINKGQMYPHLPINPSVTYPYYTSMQIYPDQTSPIMEPRPTDPYYTRMQIYPGQMYPC